MPTPLSTNFSLEELTKSPEADRQHIDNTTNDPVIIAALAAVARNILEPIRANFRIPFAPSSGYRCLALNTFIGSRPTSQHVRGEAVDIVLPGISNFALADWIRQNLTFDQLILEFYHPGQPSSGWVHCSFVPTRPNRGDVKTTTNGQSFTAGLVP